MRKGLPGQPGQNHLIATLPEAERARLMNWLTPCDLKRGMVLETPGERIESVYFPTSGVGSVIVTREKRSAEAGLFGREGMSGTSLVVDTDVPLNQTTIQIAGKGYKIAADILRDMLDQSPALRHHLLHFVHALMVQTSQTVLSNAKAKLEERLARWLLMCHDRIEGDRIKLTHDILAIMLGVRRAGVTVGTHVLEGKGIIRASRGSIEILDRHGLEAEALQSYGVAEAEYRRLFHT